MTDYYRYAFEEYTFSFYMTNIMFEAKCVSGKEIKSFGS